MKKIYYPLAICFAFLNLNFFVAQTQTGPGGVGTTSTMAYWFDASTLSSTYANNDLIPTWFDISGNGNDATQGTAGSQPTFISSSASFNGLPAVNFDSDFLNTGAIASLNANVISWFTASKLNNIPVAGDRGLMTTNTSLKVNQYGQYIKANQFGHFVQNASYHFNENPIGIGLTPAQMMLPRLHSNIWKSNGDLLFFMDGNLVGSKTGINQIAGTHNYTRLGAYSNNPAINFWRGDLAEIFAYTIDINSAQNIIVTNYLSTKYNLSCGALDRYSHDATHGNELAGIGRQDASNQHLSARGTGVVEVVSSSLDNGDYLFWGHNNASLSNVTSNTPSTYATSDGVRLEREWRVTETGETGTITLSFDITGNDMGPENDYELLIDTDGDFSNAVSISGTFLNGIVTFTVTGAQLSNGEFFTLGNTNVHNVRSIISGQDWNQTSTWSCGCIPDNTYRVTISDDDIVTVSDIQSVGRLTINSNAEITITDAGVFTIVENVEVVGTMNSTKLGQVIFAGSTLQNVQTNGTISFGILEINNPAGVNLLFGNFSLSNLLTLTDGSLDFGFNTFTFLSDASGTAMINEITPSGTLLNTFNARIQRFIPAGVAGYRNIGTAHTMMPLDQWDDELFISGPGFPDGCAFSSNGCYRSARFWNASTQSYNGIGNISDLIPNGIGVEIWLGDNLTSFGQNTLISSGEINTSLSTDITILPGWNLVANPYLAPIDFDDIIRNSVGTGNYHYVWDPNTNGFQYWDGGAQVSSIAHLNNGILAPFQGFWIFHTGAATTITVNQNAKSIGSSDLFLRQVTSTEPSTIFTIELTQKESNFKTSTSIKFNDGFDLNFDENDIPKMPENMVDGLSGSIYTKTNDGKDVVVNGLPTLSDCFKLPIYFNVLNDGKYTLTFNEIPKDYNVSIFDKNTGKVVKLKEGVDYEFSQFDVLSHVNRFELQFEKDYNCINTFKAEETDIKIVTLNNKTISIQYSESPKTDYIIEVYNLVGQKIYTSNQISNDVFNFEFNLNDNSGMYIVKVIDQSGNCIKVDNVLIINKK